VTVVGSVGAVAGKLLDGTGTVLDTAAGAISGTILLLGDVLNATGHVLGSTLTGLGGTLTMAGGLVSGGSFASAGAAGAGLTEPVMTPGTANGGAGEAAPKPTKAPTRRTRPGGSTRPPGTPA
jgi:hypothetical protein